MTATGLWVAFGASIIGWISLSIAVFAKKKRLAEILALVQIVLALLLIFLSNRVVF